MKTISQEQWYGLCDMGSGKPVPLAQADLSKSFVYHREYGVFPVNFGAHQQVMALLYAWHHGYAEHGRHAAYEMLHDLREQGKAKPLSDASLLADKFLEEIEGTAFRSSVGKKVNAGKRGNLTVIEKRWFGEITYLMDD
jgi:hypothetical protein